MERLPITGETLDKSIHEVLDKEELPVGDLENEIIEEIVNSFPKTPTGLSFARWCKYTVNDLIKKIPADRNDKAKWVENMQKASFDGADGKIVFDDNGIRIPELKIGTIKGGKLPE